MPAEITLTTTTASAFKRRITVQSNGVATSVSDRTITGFVSVKPKGIILAQFQITPRDQSLYPGQVDLYIPFTTMRKMPLDPAIMGFRLPTRYCYDVSVTYANDPNHDPELSFYGQFLVFPGA